MFNDSIDAMALREITRVGSRFTWTNKQLNPVRSVLDRVFVMPSWEACYPLCSLSVVTRIGSDHTSLLLSSRERSPVRATRFFFCHRCDNDRCYRGQHFVDAGTRRRSHLRNEVHRTRDFTRVQPLRRVKGLRPARSYCSDRLQRGGSVGRRTESYGGMEIVDWIRSRV
jgi:hypothetical protein